MKSMKIQTMKPLNKKIKHSYLMYVDNGCMHPIAQLKVSEGEFWNNISNWLCEDFGVKVRFVMSGEDKKEVANA